jgi:hypothetical protein
LSIRFKQERSGGAVAFSRARFVAGSMTVPAAKLTDEGSDPGVFLLANDPERAQRILDLCREMPVIIVVVGHGVHPCGEGEP